ncbi:MAG: hypothetical protein ACXVHB_05880 [Solirubrobacteraceae bacterium]
MASDLAQLLASGPGDASLGQNTIAGATSAARTANSVYAQRVAVGTLVPLTGIIIANNAASGNVIVSIWDSLGNLVVSSGSVVMTGGIQAVPFSSPTVLSPGVYYIGVQYSSGSATVWNGTLLVPSAVIAQGGFAAPASIASGLPMAPQSASSIPCMLTY